jgi:hypothetical protein
MDNREKFDFILEQMRLALLKVRFHHSPFPPMPTERTQGDYIRTEILSRKVSPKALRDVALQVRPNPHPIRAMAWRLTAVQDLKLRFFDLMSKYYQHERRYLDLVRAGLEVYATPSVAESEKQWTEARLVSLSGAVWL